jgi:hypothetical protein
MYNLLNLKEALNNVMKIKEVQMIFGGKAWVCEQTETGAVASAILIKLT